MEYRNLEEMLYRYTEGWTLHEGSFPLGSRADLENAKDILSRRYSNVDEHHLDIKNNDENGTNYRIKFSEPILSESRKKKELQFMPNLDPEVANEGPIGSGLGQGGMSEEMEHSSVFDLLVEDLRESSQPDVDVKTLASYLEEELDGYSKFSGKSSVEFDSNHIYATLNNASRSVHHEFQEVVLEFVESYGFEVSDFNSEELQSDNNDDGGHSWLPSAGKSTYSVKYIVTLDLPEEIEEDVDNDVAKSNASKFAQYLNSKIGFEDEIEIKDDFDNESCTIFIVDEVDGRTVETEFRFFDDGRTEVKAYDTTEDMSDISSYEFDSFSEFMGWVRKEGKYELFNRSYITDEDVKDDVVIDRLPSLEEDIKDDFSELFDKDYGRDYSEEDDVIDDVEPDYYEVYWFDDFDNDSYLEFETIDEAEAYFNEHEGDEDKLGMRCAARDEDGNFLYDINFKYSKRLPRQGVEESIEKHDDLNPDLFLNNELRDDVKDKILEIVDYFKENLAEDDIKFDIKDILIVGSNASYNYTDDSDIDVHIVADTSVYDDKADLAAKVYEAYKRLFNNKYEPTIRGHEVELYVDPDENHARSNGVYSLNTGWIKEPVNKEIPEVDQSEIDSALEPFVKRADEANTLAEVESIIDDIYLLRQKGMLEDGEYSVGNLVFKEFRNKGYLNKLKELKVSLENDEMSLESLIR